MAGIPVVGFAAWSGVGKTTLIEGLIPALRALGGRVAVIKHDVHGLSLDSRGKDSRRFVEAGADAVIACSGNTVLMTERDPLALEDLLPLIHDVDLILVEGFKDRPMAQIGIYRASSGKDLPREADSYVALVAEGGNSFASVPVFTFGETDRLARFLWEHRGEFVYPYRPIHAND